MKDDILNKRHRYTDHRVRRSDRQINHSYTQHLQFFLKLIQQQWAQQLEEYTSDADCAWTAYTTERLQFTSFILIRPHKTHTTCISRQLDWNDTRKRDETSSFSRSSNMRSKTHLKHDRLSIHQWDAVKHHFTLQISFSLRTIIRSHIYINRSPLKGSYHTINWVMQLKKSECEHAECKNAWVVIWDTTKWHLHRNREICRRYRENPSHSNEWTDLCNMNINTLQSMMKWEVCKSNKACKETAMQRIS